MQRAFNNFQKTMNGMNVPAEEYLPESKVVATKHFSRWVTVTLCKDFKAEYKLTTIGKQYLPALLDWFSHAGYKYEDGLLSILRNQIKQMVKNNDVTNAQRTISIGAPPLMKFDLNFIARAYPNGVRDKVSVMAWLSLGINTGLRGVSLAGLFWEHFLTISQPFPRKDPDMRRAKLLVVIGKGEQAWDHRVIVEGRRKDSSGCNSWYWLESLFRLHMDDWNMELSMASVRKLNNPLFCVESKHVCSGPMTKWNPEPSRRNNRILGILKQHQAAFSGRIQAVTTYCGYRTNYFLLTAPDPVCCHQRSWDIAGRITTDPSTTYTSFALQWVVGLLKTTATCRSKYNSTCVNFRLVYYLILCFVWI